MGVTAASHADAMFRLHLDSILAFKEKEDTVKTASSSNQAQAWEKSTPNCEYDFAARLLRRLIPPLRLKGKLIQMKMCRPPELMRFIITPLLLPLLLMTAVTQMRIKRLHKSFSRDTHEPLVLSR